jgi:hypothetical protein
MTTFASWRSVIAGLAAFAALTASFRSSLAQPLPKIVVTKDPTCGCCAGWVDHLRASGFTADVVESSDMGG